MMPSSAQNPIKKQGNILFGTIARYNKDTGRYHVKYQGYTGDPRLGEEALLLSPIPFTDGGGLKAVPKVPLDTPCILYNAGSRWVILGFLTPGGTVINDGPFQTRPIAEGETFLTQGTGSKIGLTANGSILMWASLTMNAILNPIKKQFTAFFKNMYINLAAGHIAYKYDEDKKTSQFTIRIQKDVDLSPINPGTLATDSIVARAGVLDDKHIAEVEIKQKADAAGISEFHAIAKIGKQEDGTWLSLTSTNTPASPTSFDLKADTTGKIVLTSQSKTDTKSVKLTLDPAQTNVVELTVNKDKAIVTIDAQGNITLKQTDAAKLYLGGKDKAQQLVTKKWLDLIFKSHMHPTAGTGPPSPPTVIDVPATGDSVTNVTTFTTLAE